MDGPTGRCPRTREIRAAARACGEVEPLKSMKKAADGTELAPRPQDIPTDSDSSAGSGEISALSGSNQRARLICRSGGDAHGRIGAGANAAV